MTRHLLIAVTTLLTTIPALAPAQRKSAAEPPQPMVDEKYGSPAELMALPETKLIAILQDGGASMYAKAKACQRLAVMGGRGAVPALAALLTDPQLSHYARFGLEPIADPAADETLRAALGKVKGKLLVGVINSIGRRGDKQAIELLAKLLKDADADVANAASAALALIRPPL